MTGPQRLVLRAFSIWTLYVWGTRIWNIVRDPDTTTAFKAVHAVLAVVSIAFAVAAWIVVSRVARNRETAPVGAATVEGVSSERREQRFPHPPAGPTGAGAARR